MSLPDPLPDDPRKWDGWRNYNSSNPYEALGFDASESPDADQIEAAYRELVLWWQKKLPLRSQPANPLSQLLRPGLDEAPQSLAVAKAALLDPVQRALVDATLVEQSRTRASAEFARYVDFSIHGGRLSVTDHGRLLEYGGRQGLDPGTCGLVIESRLAEAGASLDTGQPRAADDPGPARPAPAVSGSSQDAEQEFLRMLSMAKVEELRMTPEQREGFLNLGESLGLDEYRAEELLELAAFGREVNAVPAGRAAPPPPPRPKPAPTPPVSRPPDPAPVSVDPGSATPVPDSPSMPHGRPAHAPFRNSLGSEMVFIGGGQFRMGSEGNGAAPNEGPVTNVQLSPFFISRVPVTNAEYEAFDADHRSRRLPGTDGTHPVVYVSCSHAQSFCRWLSLREKRRYRLPTEAEWEFVAKGGDDRPYPWGSTRARGDLANFADKNTRFPHSDPDVDDGYASTSPVGNYPRGASPCGLLDLAGNVWEWCLDGYANYPGGFQTDPQGMRGGPKRVLRGGSWRSRFSSLTTTGRSFNTPEFTANDIGFRIVCEVQ